MSQAMSVVTMPKNSTSIQQEGGCVGETSRKGKVLGIDASNIRAGGGVTHLVELLKAAKPYKHGFEKVKIWGGEATLNKIEDLDWIEKRHDNFLDRGLIFRVYWQRIKLSDAARSSGCDVLLVPGGSYAGSFRPIVTLSQNLLPFEWGELKRFGWSMMTLKLLLLYGTQSRTFRGADGLIFLTQYARERILERIRQTSSKTDIIPHGISRRFFKEPREQKQSNKFSSSDPCRIIYVSIIDVYKHQWQVAKAVMRLRDKGIPVKLDLVGPAYSPALRRLQRTLQEIDPERKAVNYVGPVSHDQIHDYYAQADICVFASSCENMPNILIEGMASGLPIACSCLGPMPEVLGDAGVYFNPEKPCEIANALRGLIESPDLRARLAHEAFERAKAFSWEQCADETLGFIAKVAHLYIAKK